LELLGLTLPNQRNRTVALRAAFQQADFKTLRLALG
jgi:hypothetical protein